MGESRIENEIEHFSKMDHIWWGARTPAGQKRYDNKLDLLIKKAGSLKGKKVLEIGSGDGEFTRRLAKTSAEIIATDITPAVIKRGKRKLKFKNVNFYVANAEKLEYEEESFDLVCGVSILHHLNAEKALKEALRVLKSGGKIYFTEPNRINPHIYLGINIPYLREKMEFSPDEKPFLRSALKSLVKKTGFKEVEVTNYDFLHPLTPPPVIGIVEKIGALLETIPLVKEISGSFVVWAEKP